MNKVWAPLGQGGRRRDRNAEGRRQNAKWKAGQASGRIGWDGRAWGRQKCGVKNAKCKMGWRTDKVGAGHEGRGRARGREVPQSGTAKFFGLCRVYTMLPFYFFSAGRSALVLRADLSAVGDNNDGSAVESKGFWIVDGSSVVFPCSKFAVQGRDRNSDTRARWKRQGEKEKNKCVLLGSRVQARESRSLSTDGNR